MFPRFWKSLSALTVCATLSLLLPCADATAQNLLVGEYANERTFQVAPDGTNLGVFCSSATSGGNRFYGMTLDASGNLYVARASNPGFVSRFSPTGADLGIFATIGLNDADDVKFDTAGNLYVSSSGNGTVHRYSPTGADMGVFASVLTAEHLVFAQNGNLLVSDIADGNVHSFSSSGQDLGIFASGLVNPGGMTFDAAGNLYVANRDQHNIRRFSSTGTDLGIFASSGLSDPLDLTFGPDSDLYVADFANGAVRRFSPTGADLGNFATGLANPAGLVFRPAPAAVPEPGALAWLVGAVAVGAGFRRRSRR